MFHYHLQLYMCRFLHQFATCQVTKLSIVKLYHISTCVFAMVSVELYTLFNTESLMIARVVRNCTSVTGIPFKYHVIVAGVLEIMLQVYFASSPSLRLKIASGCWTIYGEPIIIIQNIKYCGSLNYHLTLN